MYIGTLLVLFLTAGLWAKGSSCSVQGFFWFFLVSLVARRRHMENVTDIVFFIGYKHYFPLVVIRCWISRNIKYIKKGITSAMECADSCFHFCCMTND